MSLGSFTCPNLIQSSMNIVNATTLTALANISNNIDLQLSPDNSFICNFLNIGNPKNLSVTGKYNDLTKEITLYNELLPEEISGVNTLIQFALITNNGETVDGCAQCSNACFGSNGTLAPIKINMNGTKNININNKNSYVCIMQTEDNQIISNSNVNLPADWPTMENYRNKKDYIIDCCKYSLYFRNATLCSAMQQCISINQLLSSNYC